MPHFECTGAGSRAIMAATHSLFSRGEPHDVPSQERVEWGNFRHRGVGFVRNLDIEVGHHNDNQRVDYNIIRSGVEHCVVGRLNDSARFASIEHSCFVGGWREVR